MSPLSIRAYFVSRKLMIVVKAAGRAGGTMFCKVKEQGNKPLFFFADISGPEKE